MADRSHDEGASGATEGVLDFHVAETGDAGSAPKALVILSHGYGAPADDLWPLADEVIRMWPSLAGQVRFVFPAAPIELEEMAMWGGRAWWPLNVEQFAEALGAGSMRDVSRATPPGLASASLLLRDLVRKTAADAQAPMSRVILGGFSQGAMVSTDAALRMTEPPAALIVMSGILLCEAEWTNLAKQRGALRVLQSHGSLDPLLPLEGGVWLHDMFVDAGLDASFIEFPGVHTIPRTMIDRLAVEIERVIDRAED